MANLIDAMAYVCQRYPGSDLSKAKLAKILYLADWKSVLDRGQQITPIEWKFNHYGPYVDDVIDTARQGRGFEIEAGWTPFGNRRSVIRYRGATPTLAPGEKATLDDIVRRVAPLSFDAFLKLVYSTYPIVSSDRGDTLDLRALADEYQRTGLREKSS